METTVLIVGLFFLAVIIWREHNMNEDAEKSGKDYERWSDPILGLLSIFGLIMVLSSTGMFPRNSMSTVPIIILPFLAGFLVIRASRSGTQASVYATIAAVTLLFFLILA